LATRFIGPLFSTINGKIKQASDLMGSMVEDRLEMDPQDWPEDYVSWLLAVAPEEDKCTREVARRVLMVNFAAIHTSTMVRTFYIYSKSTVVALDLVIDLYFI
jgi:hypothetical protein